MKRSMAFLLGFALIVVTGMFVTAGPANSDTIPLAWDQDAVDGFNYDTNYSGDPDIGQWFPGVSARLAKEGRDDHPIPGLIEESGIIMEFDLSSLSASTIGSAKINLTPWAWYTDNGYTTASVSMLVEGYAGDGSISNDDFKPSGAMDLGSVDVSSLDPFQIDVTGFINGLLSSGEQWAGVNLLFDYASLPDRSSLPDGDTTIGISFYSADTFGGAFGPTLEVASVPEPAMGLWLGFGLLGLAGAARRRRTWK